MSPSRSGRRASRASRGATGAAGRGRRRALRGGGASACRRRGRCTQAVSPAARGGCRGCATPPRTAAPAAAQPRARPAPPCRVTGFVTPPDPNDVTSLMPPTAPAELSRDGKSFRPPAFLEDYEVELEVGGELKRKRRGRLGCGLRGLAAAPRWAAGLGWRQPSQRAALGQPQPCQPPTPLPRPCRPAAAQARLLWPGGRAPGGGPGPRGAAELAEDAGGEVIAATGELAARRPAPLHAPPSPLCAVPLLLYALLAPSAHCALCTIPLSAAACCCLLLPAHATTPVPVPPFLPIAGASAFSCDALSTHRPCDANTLPSSGTVPSSVALLEGQGAEPPHHATPATAQQLPPGAVAGTRRRCRPAPPGAAGTRRLGAALYRGRGAPDGFDRCQLLLPCRPQQNPTSCGPRICGAQAAVRRRHGILGSGPHICKPRNAHRMGVEKRTARGFAPTVLAPNRARLHQRRVRPGAAPTSTPPTREVSNNRRHGSQEGAMAPDCKPRTAGAGGSSGSPAAPPGGTALGST